jgi:phosphoglycolate phosphatase
LCSPFFMVTIFYGQRLPKGGQLRGMASVSATNTVDIVVGEKIFKEIQAIVFDKDGTLANTEAYLVAVAHARIQALATQVPGLEASVQATLGFDKASVDPAGVLAVGGHYETVVAVAATIAQLGYPWIKSLELAQWAFRQAEQTLAYKASYTKPLPGAIALLQQLKHAGIPVALLSADTQAEVETFVATYQLGEYFAHLQGLSEALPSKVQPGFLAVACDAMQVKTHKTLVIGDAASDLTMARLGEAAGFIGVNGGWQRSIQIHNLSEKDGLAIDLYQILVKPSGINESTRNTMR